MPDDGLTLKKLRDAAKLIGSSAFASPGAFDYLRQMPKADFPDTLFGPPISYLGIRVYEAPRHLFRLPEKPLRSRPRRIRRSMTWRKRVRAERIKLKPLTRVYRCRWLKGRKVPDRRGYSHRTVFWFNPNVYA